MSAHIDMAIRLLDDSQMDLRDLVIIGKTAKALLSQNVKSFSGMEQHAQALSLPDETLRDLEIQIKPDDVVNLQFTSGMKDLALIIDYMCSLLKRAQEQPVDPRLPC